MNLFFILICSLLFTANSYGQGLCSDVFDNPNALMASEAATTSAGDLLAESQLTDGKKIETEPIPLASKRPKSRPSLSLEKQAEQVREVFQMTEAELEGFVAIARKEFDDKSLRREDVLHKLYEEKRKFDALIDGELNWFGFRLSQPVRQMRKRRQEF